MDAPTPAWIEVVELQRRLAAGDDVVLVDVRQPEEFTAPPGHLPGAINVPLGDLSGRVGELCVQVNLLSNWSSPLPNLWLRSVRGVLAGRAFRGNRRANPGGRQVGSAAQIAGQGGADAIGVRIGLLGQQAVCWSRPYIVIIPSQNGRYLKPNICEEQT